jgi:hypothetical protein
MQKRSTFAMVIIAVAIAATAGTLGIGPTTMITAYGQTSQPPITSNDECLPGSVVHCIDDDEENPPNSNEDCLPGSQVHCIDDDGDHGNLRGLFELNVDELLQLDADELLERFGHDN